MTLSDPTFGGINGGITTADTKQHRELQTEAIMNSSVMYMHEVCYFGNDGLGGGSKIFQNGLKLKSTPLSLTLNISQPPPLSCESLVWLFKKCR